MGKHHGEEMGDGSVASYQLIRGGRGNVFDVSFSTVDKCCLHFTLLGSLRGFHTQLI